MGDDLRALMMIGPLVLLAACGAKPPPAPPPAPVADPASDFSKPIDLRGTGPNWSATIRGGVLTLSRPDQADVVATAPGAVIQPGEAKWTGKTADGAEMTVSLYASACDDGAGDHAYPWSAEVDLPNQNSLNGCADQTAALDGKSKP